MAMIYSPFDALGLQPGLYTLSHIQKAYKKASLICHPDKRRIDQSHWPSQEQVQDAYEYLKVGCQSALDKFGTYPQTFFPLQNPYFPPLAIKKPFVPCPVCSMVLLDENFNEHVSVHGLEPCSICKKLLAGQNLDQHYQRIHQSKCCPHCAKIMPETELGSHTLNQHKCPLCFEEYGDALQHLESYHNLTLCWHCGQGNLQDHIREEHLLVTCHFCRHRTDVEYIEHHLSGEHYWQPCDNCKPDEDENFLEHVWAYHLCGKCPVCCREIVESELISHMFTTHAFQRCSGCPPTGIDSDHLRDAHQWDICEVCSEFKAADILSEHLCLIHSWRKCYICGTAEPADESLQEHIQHHPVENCPECLKQIFRNDYHPHMREKHSYKDCPFCDETGTLEYLRHHIQESHDLSERCPVCPNFQTKTGLPYHLKDEHRWTQCLFCDKLSPEDDAEEHVRRDHDPRPCPDCADIQSASDLISHRINAHSYKQCNFCPILSKELLQHILSNHGPSDEPRPPILGQSHQQNESHIATTTSGRSQVVNSVKKLVAVLDSLVNRSQDIEIETHYLDKICTESEKVISTLRGCIADGQNTGLRARSLRILSTPKQLPSKESNTQDLAARTEQAVTEEEEPVGEEPVGEPARSPPRANMANTRKRQDMPVGPRLTKKAKAMHPLDNSVRDLVAGVLSKVTLLKFFDLVKAMKADLSWRECFQIEDVNRVQKLSRFSRLGDAFENKISSARLLKELALILMVQELDSTMGNDTRQRVDPEEIRRILEHQGRDVNAKNRARVNGQIERGRKLLKACGPFLGSLCFIVLNGSLEKYLELAKAKNKQDLANFHQILGDYNEQWKAAENFLVEIQRGALQDYLFENWNHDELESASSLELLRGLLKPFRTVDENIYGLGDTRPDSIPSADRQCDLCSHCTMQSPCNCLDTCFPQPPKIADFGAVGRGLIAFQEGCIVVYPKGSRIGQITGRYVERGSHEDGWAIEFEIPNTRQVLCLYTREEGNNFRLVNHACIPSAKLNVKKISGKWRAVLIAAKDILHSEPITVNWGLESLQEGMPCFCNNCKSFS